jgi:hypothetical protein
MGDHRFIVDSYKDLYFEDDIHRNKSAVVVSSFVESLKNSAKRGYNQLPLMSDFFRLFNDGLDGRLQGPLADTYARIMESRNPLFSDNAFNNEGSLLTVYNYPRGFTYSDKKYGAGNLKFDGMQRFKGRFPIDANISLADLHNTNPEVIKQLCGEYFPRLHPTLQEKVMVRFPNTSPRPMTLRPREYFISYHPVAATIGIADMIFPD